MPRPKTKPNVPAIIKGYSEGKPVSLFAAENSVSTQAIYDWMFTDLGPKQYRETITKALVRRIHDADKALDGADDMLAFARAREQTKLARLDFERRRPHLYGQKQEITHSVNPTLNISVVPQPQIPQEKVIEGVLLPSAKDNT